MSTSLSLTAQWIFENDNNQWLYLGSFVDGVSAITPPLIYINDLTVTASLYQNRVRFDRNQPGTLVPTFGTAGAASLLLVSGNQGIYRALIGSALDSDAREVYVLVIDAVNGAGYQGHWELQAGVIPRST